MQSMLHVTKVIHMHWGYLNEVCALISHVISYLFIYSCNFLVSSSMKKFNILFITYKININFSIHHISPGMSMVALRASGPPAVMLPSELLVQVGQSGRDVKTINTTTLASGTSCSSCPSRFLRNQASKTRL